MTSPPRKICSYQVDAEFRITLVAGDWAKFAVENAAPELAHPVSLRQRTLFSYIADEATRQVYRAMFDRVAARAKPITVPLRCDSPHVRRFLELTISPREDGGFHLDSSLLRTEPRPYLALLDATHPRSHELIRMCGWCKAVQVNEDWVELEQGVEMLDLFGRNALPEIKHGVCKSCYAGLRENFGPHT